LSASSDSEVLLKQRDILREIRDELKIKIRRLSDRT